MIEKTFEEIEFERETSKIGLDQFVDNLKENSFSEIVFKQTEQLQKELNEKINDFFNSHPIPDQGEFYYYQLDTDFLEDKLLALSQMNIIYAFKDFEINVKKLLKASYGIDPSEFYKWESLLTFLKSKNIKPSELQGYKEIDELRKINNHIKHSTTQKINDKIKNIQEFKELVYLEHRELITFFTRIKYFPYTFLYSLSNEIYKDLYVFDSNRLTLLAKEFALRMDKSTTELFIEKLKGQY